MIRGVSRQIVEISETGHPYFERAFLVVRTDCEQTGDGDGLRREADRFVNGSGAYSGLRIQRRRRKIRAVLFNVFTGMLGTMAGLLLALLIR